MDKLNAELQRLHFLTERSPAARQQALGVAFTRAEDWRTVNDLCQAILEELDLPIPAISINGQGYQLWFSLAEAVEPGQAARFLDGLRHRYLADLPDSRLHFGLPDELPPCQLADDERWAAFIDPGMGSMFIGDPWLDIPPNRNQQADLLAGCKPIGAADFTRALDILQPSAGPMGESNADNRTATVLSMRGEFTDPRQFLLAVMNDAQASADQRIEAAKALLPYFEAEKGAKKPQD